MVKGLALDLHQIYYHYETKHSATFLNDLLRFQIFLDILECDKDLTCPHGMNHVIHAMLEASRVFN